MMTIVDAHLDIAYNAALGRDPTRSAREQIDLPFGLASVGLPDLRAGNVGLICATIFAQPQTEHAPWGYSDASGAHAQALSQVNWYRQRVDDGQMRLVRTGADLPDEHSNVRTNVSISRAPAGEVRTGRDILEDVGMPPSPQPPAALPFVLLMEGADPIRSLDDANLFFDAGVRIVGMAWKRTRYAGGTSQPGPLTPEGRTLVRELDRLGIIHDASHLAEESFFDLLDITDRPVIASHSNCRAIVPGDRHLSDEMIRAIARRGGVIGINFFDKFLLPPAEHGKRRATLKDVVHHIQHICDLVGDASHVGLGTDMDGGLGREQIPVEIESSADLSRIADALSMANFADDAVVAIVGRTWIEYFQKHLPS